MDKQAYIKTLGLNTCREIIANAPPWAKYWITGNEYHIDFITFPNMVNKISVYIDNLRAEFSNAENE